MKRTFAVFLILLAISTSTFAGLKPKQIVGNWKYEMTLYNGQDEGSFVFTQIDGQLEGEVIQSDGRVSKLSNIKVNKKNETLCFNILRENDVSIEFILIVDHNKFKGKGWINDADFDIAGDKILNQ